MAKNTGKSGKFVSPKMLETGLTIHGNCWSFEIRQISHEIGDFVKSSGFHEILGHSLPSALHKTEEFFLNYLIYKVCNWISH